MIKDPPTPVNLAKVQRWFADIITRPIDEESRMNPISPTGASMEHEAPQFIIPSPTLRPDQRIELYNQQYWWRLLKALHESYPFLLRLFGYHDFNQTIAVPFLTKNPPDHWSLAMLGHQLPQWIENEYQQGDKSLVHNAAKIDWAYNWAFLAPEQPALAAASLPKNNDIADLMACKVNLQPYITLFSLPSDLFNFRFEFLKQEPEYWLVHDFPDLKKDRSYYFILYRNQKNNIAWIELSEAAYLLLSHLQQGTSIEEACDWLETQNESVFEEATTKLHLWLQDWIIRKWLFASK
jgi:hypothetical protein